MMNKVTYDVMELKLVLFLNALGDHFLTFPALYCVSSASGFMEAELGHLNRLFAVGARFFLNLFCIYNFGG